MLASQECFSLRSPQACLVDLACPCAKKSGQFTSLLPPSWAMSSHICTLFLYIYIMHQPALRNHLHGQNPISPDRPPPRVLTFMGAAARFTKPFSTSLRSGAKLWEWQAKETPTYGCVFFEGPFSCGSKGKPKGTNPNFWRVASKKNRNTCCLWVLQGSNP